MQEFEPNYILLDAAAMASFMDWLKLKTDPTAYISLYKGSAEENLSDVAPYLFQLDKDVLDFYRTYSKGNSWGIMLRSALSIELLQKHFRRFLMVKNEAGKQLYFRFYDPRVLRLFLPTCSKEQLILFFSDIEFFLMEDEDPQFEVVFACKNGEFSKQRIVL